MGVNTCWGGEGQGQAAAQGKAAAAAGTSHAYPNPDRPELTVQQRAGTRGEAEKWERFWKDQVRDSLKEQQESNQLVMMHKVRTPQGPGVF